MIVLLYLAVGLVVVGKHTREEVSGCGGMEVMVVLLLWPLYLVVRAVEWMGEEVRDYVGKR